MTSRSSARTWQHPALTAALQALKFSKRKPTDDDRPAASTLPGRKAKVIPGQLELGMDAARLEWLLTIEPDDDDLVEEMTAPEDPVEAAKGATETAEAMLVLAEMARERGVISLAALGDLPPLDPETKAKYLARAKAREARGA